MDFFKKNSFFVLIPLFLFLKDNPHKSKLIFPTFLIKITCPTKLAVHKNEIET